MKIVMGCDHRGFGAKEIVKSVVAHLGHELIDMGAVSDSPVDYPDVAYQAAIAVSTKDADRAILICATGIGMCIAANKVDGVRAALCHDAFSAGVSREHNDSNVLCVSAEQSGEFVLRKMIETWLGSEFSGGRHERRVQKIGLIEQGQDPRETSTANGGATRE